MKEWLEDVNNNEQGALQNLMKELKVMNERKRTRMNASVMDYSDKQTSIFLYVNKLVNR